MTAHSPRIQPLESSSLNDWPGEIFAILFGVIATLCVCGYQFGHGDHTVYLTEPLHLAYPNLLARDWFTTQTLQYHSAFSWIASLLLRAGLLRQGFLVGYVGLLFAFHISWYQIVRSVGGSLLAYLLSVVLWLSSNSGTALASYHFFQDSELLAANISSVALLVGISFWISRRPILAGLAFGVSGFFHLDYSCAAIAAWTVLILLQSIDNRQFRQKNLQLTGVSLSALIIGSVLMLAGALPNILHALPAALAQSHGIDRRQFIELYVQIRHPHHYQPSSWAWMEWINFLWPIPAAVMLFYIWRKSRVVVDPVTQFARRQITRIYSGFIGALIIAFIGAGIWYVSIALIQLSIYRFGIFVHLLGCTAAAYLLCDAGLYNSAIRAKMLLALAALLAMVQIVDAAFILRIPPPTNDSPYARVFIPAILGLALLTFLPAVVAILQNQHKPKLERRCYQFGLVCILLALGFRRGNWRGWFTKWIRRPVKCGCANG